MNLVGKQLWAFGPYPRGGPTTNKRGREGKPQPCYCSTPWHCSAAPWCLLPMTAVASIPRASSCAAGQKQRREREERRRGRKKKGRREEGRKKGFSQVFQWSSSWSSRVTFRSPLFCLILLLFGQYRVVDWFFCRSYCVVILDYVIAKFGFVISQRIVDLCLIFLQSARSQNMDKPLESYGHCNPAVQSFCQVWAVVVIG